MALLDLLGRRWTLRIIWELRDQALTFRELQERCGEISSSVLNQRITELTDAGITGRGERGYRLTERGEDLAALYPALDSWANAWAAQLRAEGSTPDGVAAR